MTISDARRAAQIQLQRKADLCSSALIEARRLVAALRFEPILSQVLDRACELLDDIDEVLIGLYPRRDDVAFGRAAVLHRELEEIQALLPQEYRRLRRA